MNNDLGIYRDVYRHPIISINCLRAKGYKMKRKNTKIMSEEDEEKLFKCDIYGDDCECTKKTIIKMILVFFLSFTLGLNCAEQLEKSKQRMEVSN